MSRQAIEDAYIAGFNDGRDSVGKVADNDVITHCMLGFDGWYAKSLETLDRSPIAADADGWIAWDGTLDYPPDVTRNTVVDIKTRRGLVNGGNFASVWQWRFRQVDPQDNIIAYRVQK